MSQFSPSKSQNRSKIGSGVVRQIKLQMLGLGIGLGFATSAMGQLGGFGNTNQGGMGQLGSIGQLGQMGGQTGVGGIGGIGQQQMGTGQAGLGGVGQNSGISQLGSPNIANAFGSGGILGQNTSSAFGGLANAALLGRTLNGGAGAMGGLGGMGMGGMNGMGGRGGMQGGRGGFNSMNQNQNSNKPQIRATVKLGFEVAPVSNSVSTQVVNTRLSRVPSAVLNGVNVQMNGRTAVIRGDVATLADAKVVERYLSLEPGIDAVKNELVIASGEKLVPKSTASKKTKATKQKSIDANSDAPDSTVKAASPELVPAPGPQ